MKIEFESITLKNFGSFESLVDFPFKEGKHLVIGDNQSSKSSNSNGAGKSTVFEAVPWCLYKQSTRSRTPGISRRGEGDCMVSLKFRVGDSQYKLDRYHGWSKTLEYNPALFKDEEEISERKSADTERTIQSLCRIPYDLFVNTVVVLQGLPINFGTLGPTVRKSIVEHMLGFSVWEGIRGKFQHRLKTKEMEYNESSLQFSSSREKMIAINSQVETHKKIQSDIQQNYDDQIVDLKAKMKAAQRDIKAYETRYREIFGDADIGSAYNELNSLRSSLTIMNNRSADLSRIIQEHICPGCGQDYPHSMIDSAHNELSKLLGKIESTQIMVSEKQFKINQASEIQGNLNHYKTTFNSLNGQLQSIVSKMNVPKENIDLAAMQQELERLLSTVQAYSEELSSIQGSIENIKYIDKLLLPSSHFRTKVLEKYLDYINSIIGSITPMVFDDIQCSLRLSKDDKGLDIEVLKDNLEWEYKSLSGGEKRRLDVIMILSFQKFLMESSGISTNLLVFDEIFDSLDIQGVNSVVNCIDTLFPEASCIYVITHNDAVKSQFDSVIKVVNRNKTSYIEGYSDVEEAAGI